MFLSNLDNLKYGFSIYITLKNYKDLLKANIILLPLILVFLIKYNYLLVIRLII